MLLLTVELVNEVELEALGCTFECTDVLLVGVQIRATVHFDAEPGFSLSDRHAHPLVVAVKVGLVDAKLVRFKGRSYVVLGTVLVKVGVPERKDVCVTVLVAAAVSVTGVRCDVTRALAQSSILDRDINRCIIFVDLSWNHLVGLVGESNHFGDKCQQSQAL